MFPLHDDNPTKDTSIVVYSLIVLNVLIFFYQQNLSRTDLADWLNTWAMIPVQLNRRFASEWFTFFSYQFLHGGVWHLIGNMWFLYLFGNNVEDQLGSMKFLGFYLACGVLGALAQIAFSPTSPIPMVGASGSIAGVMGAYIIRFPKAKILTLVFLGFFFTFINVPAVVFLGIWIAGQTIAATFTDPSQAGTAYLAHVGGFGAGVLLWQLFPKRMVDKPPKNED
jgi:membrane associated rhomboid family serine protease